MNAAIRPQQAGVNRAKVFFFNPLHKGLSYVMNAAIRPQNGSNLYDGLLNGNQQ